MNLLFWYIVMGIIQGLTEFLPVSSSGHLEIVRVLSSSTTDQLENQGMLMIVLLHVGTALSTLWVYQKDIKELLLSLLKREKEALMFLLFIVVSMIPAALVGVLLNDAIEALFKGNLLYISLCFAATSAILYGASKQTNEGNKPLSIPKALLIGVVQAIAILPGVSRSGSTIGTSLILGITREKAAFFSFIMVLPVIFGKMLVDILDSSEPLFGQMVWELHGVAFLVTFLTGVFACKWMVNIVKQAKLQYFALYCLILSIACFLWTMI